MKSHSGEFRMRHSGPEKYAEPFPQPAYEMHGSPTNPCDFSTDNQLEHMAPTISKESKRMFWDALGIHLLSS